MKTKLILFFLSAFFASWQLGQAQQSIPYWRFSTAMKNTGSGLVALGTAGSWEASSNSSAFVPAKHVPAVVYISSALWWVWTPEVNSAAQNSYGWVSYPFTTNPSDFRDHSGTADMLYRIKFFLPANPVLTVDLDIWGDDYVLDVSVNGNVTTYPPPPTGSTGQNGNLNVPVKFINCTNWKPNDTNTIEVHCLSSGGQAGLMVKANEPCCTSCNPNQGSISNACTTQDFVPKVDASGTGNLICSQIYDDGISVGVGVTGPFTYNTTCCGTLLGPTWPSSTGTLKLDVGGVTRSLAYLATSDERYKKDIKSINDAMSIINKLDGKTYFWRTDEFKNKGFNSSRQFGFIAQELEKVIPEVVATDDKGFKSVNYDMVIPILVQAIKEQQTQIEDLKNTPTTQQKQIDELKTLVQSLAGNSTNKSVGISGTPVNLSDKNTIVLNQNVPNPFAESTVISYNIPSDFTKAQIIFTTADGLVIKSINITQKGAGSLNVFANDLSHGMYSYTLVVDGKNIDTKKMVKE